MWEYLKWILRKSELENKWLLHSVIRACRALMFNHKSLEKSGELVPRVTYLSSTLYRLFPELRLLGFISGPELDSTVSVDLVIQQKHRGGKAFGDRGRVQRQGSTFDYYSL